MLKRSIKFAVIEDNGIMVKRIEEIIIEMLTLLKVEEDEYLINCYVTGERAIASEIEYDIIILDIDLGDGMNGFEVGKILKTIYAKKPLFIVLTSSDNRGEESSDHRFNWYLTKRSMELKLPNIISTSIKATIPIDGVFVKEGWETLFVYFDHIRFVQRKESAVYIYMIDKIIITYKERSIDDWKKLLPTDRFIMPHKSNCINLEYMDKLSVDKKEIIMKHPQPDEYVKSSISRAKEIKKIFDDYQVTKEWGLI